jgi:hypothetical protein
MMKIGRRLGWAAALVPAVVLATVAPAGASSYCQRRYQDLQQPIYDRRVRVFEFRQLTCSQAARVASAVADAYERGLPLSDYPPPPSGAPGGGGHTFQVRTFSFGTYTCRMTGRGSDFVAGRCRRGGRFVRFESDDQWFIRGRAPDATVTTR